MLFRQCWGSRTHIIIYDMKKNSLESLTIEGDSPVFVSRLY